LSKLTSVFRSLRRASGAPWSCWPGWEGKGTDEGAAEAAAIRAQAQGMQAEDDARRDAVLRETRREAQERRRMGRNGSPLSLCAAEEAGVALGGGGGEGTGRKGGSGAGETSGEKEAASQKNKKKKNKKKNKKGKQGGQDDDTPPALPAQSSAAGPDPAAEAATAAADDDQEAAQVPEDEGNQDADCSICLSLLVEPGGFGVGVEVLSCGHGFHGKCLDLWVTKCHAKQTLPTCPYCRGPLQRSV
jgi:hypothetical protein